MQTTKQLNLQSTERPLRLIKFNINNVLAASLKSSGVHSATSCASSCMSNGKNFDTTAAILRDGYTSTVGQPTNESRGPRRTEFPTGFLLLWNPDPAAI